VIRSYYFELTFSHEALLVDKNFKTVRDACWRGPGANWVPQNVGLQKVNRNPAWFAGSSVTPQSLHWVRTKIKKKIIWKSWDFPEKYI
jgi:hypothetical protein